MSRKLSLTIIALFALSFALGIFAGLDIAFSTSKTRNISSVNASEDTFKAGWDAARKKLMESEFAPLAGMKEIRSLSGEIREIDGNRIGFKYQQMDPLAGENLNDRVALVTAETKISAFIQKDAETFDKEMKEFEKKMESGKPEADPVMPPEPFTRKEIGIADLKVGDRFTVTAPENVKDLSEFKATEIIVHAAPAPIPTAEIPPRIPTMQEADNNGD